jgi:IstB-like ATP binding protein
MLHQPTLEKLEAMRLHGMAQAGRELAKSEQTGDLSFEERMALLVDRQFTWRQNEAFQARLRRAKLRANACVEDIDYRAARGLDKTLLRSLIAESDASFLSASAIGA